MSQDEQEATDAQQDTILLPRNIRLNDFVNWSMKYLSWTENENQRNDSKHKDEVLPIYLATVAASCGHDISKGDQMFAIIKLGFCHRNRNFLYLKIFQESF